MDNVNVTIENVVKNVQGIYYISNNNYYFLYTEKQRDENGYIILNIVKVLQEVVNTPTGQAPTGNLVGLSITDEEEWKNVQKDISNIIDDKQNKKREAVRYLDINLLQKLIVKNTRVFRLKEEMYNKTFGAKIVEKENKVEAPKFENITVFEENEKYEKIPAYKYCGTVFSTYLIIEMNDEMYMIDQHAAHERILYEKVKKNYYGNIDADSQVLLLPDIINLTHKEKAIVQENVKMFERAGFIIEEFGESTIRLIGVPSNCVDLDTKELFLEILDAVNTVAITAVQEKEDKFLATIACKAAVKAGQVLSANEVKELLDNLLKLPNPFTCPHGRPTAIKMNKYDIERKFHRK